MLPPHSAVSFDSRRLAPHCLYEGRGVEASYFVKRGNEAGQDINAAPDYEVQRAWHRSSEMTELFCMPVKTARPPGSGSELEGQIGDLKPAHDELTPPLPVPLSAGVDVKRRRHPLVEKFLMHEGDALHAVQIVPSGLIGKQTVIRRRDQRDV